MDTDLWAPSGAPKARRAGPPKDVDAATFMSLHPLPDAGKLFSVVRVTECNPVDKDILFSVEICMQRVQKRSEQTQ